MTNNKQVRRKQEERFLLERFLVSSGIKAEILEDRLHPDFIIDHEGRPVGLEVTEIFTCHDGSSSRVQAEESIADRIVSRARQIYRARGGYPVHISVSFRPYEDLLKVNRETVAEALASRIEQLNPQPWARVEWPPLMLMNPLPDVVSRIHGLGVLSWDMALWNVPRAAWVVPLTSQHVQSRVDEKVGRLAEYRKHASDVWLLLVTNRGKGSQMFDVDKRELDNVTSTFSRTFVYDLWNGVAIEVGRGAAEVITAPSI